MADPLGIPLGPSDTEPIVVAPVGPVEHPPTEQLPSSGQAQQPAAFKPSFPEPEAPDTTAVPELSKLALLLLVLAFIAIAKAFTDFINWLFRNMLGPLWPKTGSKQASSQAMTQGLSNYLGTFAQGVDSELGVNFTRMAETAGMLGQFVGEVGATLQLMAEDIAGIEGVQASTRNGQAALRQRQRQQAQQLEHTQTQVATAAKAQTATNHTLEQRLDQLTHHVHHVIEPELDGLRNAIPALERGAATTWDEVQKHSEAIGLAGTVAATATALSRLGAGWTRCETNQLVGKELCNTSPDQVRKLLKGLFPLIDIALLCSFVKLISQMGKNPVLLDALGVFSIGVEDLLRCTGATIAKDLPVPPLSLAPVQPWATLAPVNG